MLLQGRTTKATYGKLVTWADKDSALNLIGGLAAVPAGTGLMILEVQERILRFPRRLL